MVQLIYPFKQNRYPFGRGKENQNTYMQYILHAQDQSETKRYRQLTSFLKKLSHSNIMHLEKVLKEDTHFHMIYEFQNKSLEQYLKDIQKEDELTNVFLELQNVLDFLVEHKIKAQLYLQFMGVDQNSQLKVWLKPDEIQLITSGDTEQKIKKNLKEYYQTERTRIHLEIQEIFENSDNSNKKRNSAAETKSDEDSFDSKGKSRNFVIQGNTLKFLGGSHNEKLKNPQKIQNEAKNCDKHLMNKAHHLVYEEKPMSKSFNPTKSQEQLHQKVPSNQQQPDLSKMTVAQKVLYYKKQKEQLSHPTSQGQNRLIIKDSSTSHNDLSKSSNNDSNIQVKTEKISKNRIKIITSQEVQVQGNSDDDLQKLAREKIAKINEQNKQKGHLQESLKTKSPKHDIPHEVNRSEISETVEKFLKGLDQNTSEEYHCQQSKQINNKIEKAKLKARTILDKYSEHLKK